jgi:hypothetical protein
MSISTPSVEDTIINEEELEMNDTNIIDTTIEEIEGDLLAGQFEDEDGDEAPFLKQLDGAVISIAVHDEALLYDIYGLPIIISAIADKAQFLRVRNKLAIEDMMQKARERRDPTTNEKNRIRSESEGDVAEEVDYELTGLTPLMQKSMEAREFQNFQCDVLIADCQRWYDEVSDGSYPMLRRTDAEVKLSLLAAEKKKRTGETALKEQRSFHQAAKAKMMARLRHIQS